MNPEKTGLIIKNARLKKGLTQKQLADAISVTDKAVCKWETGRGCPDITLLSQLSRILEIDIQSILRGELVKNKSIAGNMNRIKFYRCPTCGNLVTSVKEIEISCCGNKLPFAEAHKSNDEKYTPIIKEFDGQYSVSFNHPMTKDDYIANIITVQYDKILVINLFAEQEAVVTLPQIEGLRMFLITSRDGLIAL